MPCITEAIDCCTGRSFVDRFAAAVRGVVHRHASVPFVLLIWFGVALVSTAARGQEARSAAGAAGVGPLDWPQLGGTPHRNNTPAGDHIPIDWDVKAGKHIKWTARLGTQSYGSPVVANGHIYVGTNNQGGYLERYDKHTDLGVLLCFRESDGKFLWQHSCEKLATGRVNDWPLQGICSTPVVERDRLWCVTNRGEVVCLDTEGFLDGENDGPLRTELNEGPGESDFIWSLDMMQELGVFQHNMATCGPTIWKNTLFVCTSNGVDETHVRVPAPEAPSFLALDKRTGRVLWKDNSPGKNILHGQWSCPAVGVFDGVPQVIFPGGDGWLYSFHAERWNDDGTPILLWKFDGNPKDSLWKLGGSGTRNNMVAVPVVDDGLVYVAMGQDPEHGDGSGHLWCIDPTRRGDISPELVVDKSGNVLPHRRHQAFNAWGQGVAVGKGADLAGQLNEGHIADGLRIALQQQGIELPTDVEVATLDESRDWLVKSQATKEQPRWKLSLRRSRVQQAAVLTVSRRTSEAVIPNPNSSVVWHFSQHDMNGDGEIDRWNEQFHRTISSPTIKNGLLIIPDFSGFVFCLDAKTGKPYWAADLLAQCWGSPLIVEDNVYVGDEDGDVAILKLSPNPADSVGWNQEYKMFEPLREIVMPTSIYSTPVVANNTMYLSTKNMLYAISAGDPPPSRP